MRESANAIKEDYKEARAVLKELAGTLEEAGWKPKTDFFDEDLGRFTLCLRERASNQAKPTKTGFLAAEPTEFSNSSIRDQLTALKQANAKSVKENSVKKRKSDSAKGSGM
jgi:hypothetical protein